MDIAYPPREQNTAELIVDGNTLRYVVPSITGTHSTCFGSSHEDDKVRYATDSETIAYACAALDPNRENEWTNADLIRFPSKNYLRFRNSLTTIPLNKQFGDLAGGLLVDEDLQGLGIATPLDVPEDLSGWEQTEGGIYVQGTRKFAPHETWYTENWDARNGALIALAGSPDGAEALEKASVDSGRIYKPNWRVNISQITKAVKSVPVLYGNDRDWLFLDLNDYGYGDDGCAVRVRK